MDTNLIQVAQAMIDACELAAPMDPFIDSLDAHPNAVVDLTAPGTPTTCEFTMRKDIDQKGTGAPKGHIIYTVAIKAEYVKYDDE